MKTFIRLQYHLDPVRIPPTGSEAVGDADEAPTHSVLVAAVFGIGQKTLKGELHHLLEEDLTLEVADSNFVLGKATEQGILLLRRATGKSPAEFSL
jgi:hypothetical protein